MTPSQAGKTLVAPLWKILVESCAGIHFEVNNHCHSLKKMSSRCRVHEQSERRKVRHFRAKGTGTSSQSEPQQEESFAPG